MNIQIQENKKSYDLNHNSLIPILKEIERFNNFMNNRFNLNLQDNLIQTASKTHKNTLGYFMPKNSPNHFINTTQKLHNINLNTLHLKRDVILTLTTQAHEIAHLKNSTENIKDCSSNQYHNKHFKAQAEKLLLKVERTKHGYSHTTPTKEFIKMIEEEFKPNKEVFNIEQAQAKKIKKPNKMKKFTCDCGYIIRCAKSDLKATCFYCNTEFKEEVI